MQAEELERICRAYHIEHKSIRAIAREMKHSRSTIAKAIAESTPPKDAKTPAQLTFPQKTSVFGPYQSRVEELLSLNEHLRRKKSPLSSSAIPALGKHTLPRDWL